MSVGRWRVMPLSEGSAYSNMATDEAVLEHVRDGKSVPTIRFYRWNPSAVSIGRFQSMRDEVNLDACRELGVDWVRRITGGGAVYHDRNGELTYSVIGAQDLFPKGIRESYAVICGWVVEGIRSLGIDASFVPINDIVSGGRKLSGNAQTRRDGVLLQHGTVLYSTDVSRMFSVLNVSKEKISDKMIRSVQDRVTSVSAIDPSVTFERLYRSMLGSFTKGKEWSEGSLSDGESRRAAEIAAVYSSDGWNMSR